MWIFAAGFWPEALAFQTVGTAQQRSLSLALS